MPTFFAPRDKLPAREAAVEAVLRYPGTSASKIQRKPRAPELVYRFSRSYEGIAPSAPMHRNSSTSDHFHQTIARTPDTAIRSARATNNCIPNKDRATVVVIAALRQA